MAGWIEDAIVGDTLVLQTPWERPDGVAEVIAGRAPERAGLTRSGPL